MSNCYYHLNVHNGKNAEWKVGDIIDLSGYNNYYKNMIDLCAYILSGTNNIPLHSVLMNPSFNDRQRSIAIGQLRKMSKELHRELVFERIRAEHFESLPSRSTCTYAFDMSIPPSTWINWVNESKKAYSLLIIEPFSDATVFKTNDGPLFFDGFHENDEKLEELAKVYWSGAAEGRGEVLIQGRAKVIKIVSTN